MTEPVKGRRRASRRVLRVWAWVAGGLAFLTPWVALTSAPRPTVQNAATAPTRPVVLVKKVTRRVIITPAKTGAPVRYVPSGGGAAPGGNTAAPAPAPAPAPPATSTGGS